MKSKIPLKNILEFVLWIAVIGGVLAVIIAFRVDNDLIPVVASVAASLFSLAAVLGTYMTVQEMRIDRIERNRPFILVEFPFSGSSVVYFVMRNAGTSIARNIKVQFNPSPVDVVGKKLSELSLFKTPIPIMGPATEYKFLFHVSHQLLNGDFPKKFEVSIQYTGELGELYNNSFEFDFEQFMDVILPPYTTEEYLKMISNHIERLTRATEGSQQTFRLLAETHSSEVHRHVEKQHRRFRRSSLPIAKRR